MHPFLKKLLFFGIMGIIFSILRAFFNGYSIGIYPVVDFFAEFWLFCAGSVNVIVLLLTAGSLLYFLLTCRFKQVGYSILVGLITLFAFAVLMPTVGLISKEYLRTECAENMELLGQEFRELASKHDNRIPPDWCEALLANNRIEPRDLSCRAKKFRYIIGESSYGLSKGILDLDFSILPPDTVVLFETDYAGSQAAEMITLKERSSKIDSLTSKWDKKYKIRKGAWNQIGGVEIITSSHHAGLGSNILFADGHVEFVKTKNIPKLRWKP